MDLENEKILKLVFPDGIPDNLRYNPELFRYLEKLGSCKVEELKKERTRICEETRNIIDQTEELAISNYKTFISTTENSRLIFKEFQNAEQQIDTLIDKLPQFNEKCEKFLNISGEINEERRINSLTLEKNAELLEVLELPQLMERCIREGHYESALELASYVQKLGSHQGHIPVINSIVKAVEALWHTMLVQLIAQLRTDLQLPKCLQIVGYLRRMQALGNNELKLRFLQARDSWLCTLLKAIPRDDAQQHLTKTIELTRVNLFNIITQYRAIFPDDDGTMLNTTISINKSITDITCNGDRLFQSWLHRKINDFLQTLEIDLNLGVNSMETILGQCMYFGLSFSRVGADFRALMAPIFVKVIRKNFENCIDNVNLSFKKQLETYTLINKVALHSRSKSVDVGISGEHESYAPPETLLDFLPLALLCNGYLNGLNELRLCAPIALANHITRCLQHSLEIVAQEILAFYRQEQQAFTSNEREIFVKMCTCFAYDLIPYIQKCIHAIFPQQTIINHLGLNLLQFEQEQITMFQTKIILEPLTHLLPTKMNLLLKKDVSGSVTTTEETMTSISTEPIESNANAAVIAEQ